MHRLYTQRPPHDTTLYDILEVNSNATAAQITKSYRKLSRKYHPDKQKRKRRQSNSDDDQEDEAENDQKLERIREAYEVLKTDSTRLPYHRFGLVDTVHAVFLLTGRFEDAVCRDPNLTELFHLMGYSLDHSPPPPLLDSENPGASGRASVGDQFRHKQEHNQRVKFIANNIVGTIRPLVEGSVEEAFLADLVVTQCDRLKTLPLGAQIIRCIGRAYRYAGRRVLRRYHANPKSFGIEKDPLFKSFITNSAFMSISDGLRDHLRRMFFGQQEGWVGSSGLVISSNVARIRAAAALAMIGEIMVQRSKEGTAWME